MQGTHDKDTSPSPKDGKPSDLQELGALLKLMTILGLTVCGGIVAFFFSV
jgi:hypothetical protein